MPDPSADDLADMLDRRRRSPVEQMAPVEKPTIRVVGGELTRVLMEADAALARVGDLYQRGGQIVRVTRLDARTTDARIRFAGSLTIIPVDAEYLRVALAKAARFEKYDARMEDWKRIDPPIDLARGLLSMPGEWSFRTLSGIIEAPTLRPDGSVLQVPGYDDATGLLFDPGGVTFPSVKSSPTKAEGAAALDRVDALLRDFPFEGGAARSVALCALLTCVVRRAVSTAPMFLFDAGKMGSGKSLLAEGVSLLALGRRANMTSHTSVPEEERKRLLAALMEGDTVIVIDNIDAPLSSDLLCVVLTSESFRDRVLGSSKNISVSTAATFIGTGNNIVVRGDLSTRVLLARIVVNDEQPEERVFDWSPLTYIPAHRPKLVRDVLVALRAYIAAGSPDVGLKPYGRFEAWSNLVRSAVVWFGRDDPCTTRRQLERADPIRDALIELTSAWHGYFGSAQMTAPEVVRRAKDIGGDALREALQGFLPRGDITPKALSMRLGKFRDRIEGGYRVVQVGTGRHLLWSVEVHE